MDTVHKSQKHKPVRTPGGQLRPSFLSLALVHQRVNITCSRLHAFLPQCVSSLHNLDPTCILWPRKLNGFFFLHNPKGRGMGDCQGSVSRGCNKMCGLLTLQRLFEFIQIHPHKPRSSKWQSIQQPHLRHSN